MSRWSWLLIAVLLALRLPSLGQPAGADQGLYAYVGARLLEGGLPYRDAWDQKPPGIHVTYAAMRAVYPGLAAVPAADLVVAGAVALLLVVLGRALGGTPAGIVAAALFLFLGDPTFNRLAGVRVRAQCETFIALAVTGAVLLACRGDEARPRWPRPVAAGALVGTAFVLKYNAAVYAALAAFALLASGRHLAVTSRRIALAAAGFLIPVAVVLVVFATGSALDELYYATIRYNLEYSGETYTGPISFVTYLLAFPVQQARVDALWTIGGLGCVVLIVAWARQPAVLAPLVPVIWVATACLSIAINGSRGLPQYFVQANPALALAAGLAAALLWPATWLPPRLRPAARAFAILLVAYGAWRVNDFEKIPRNAGHDLAYLTGRISREDHLARYGSQRDDKYDALAVSRLGEFLAARTTPRDYIYVFGFSPGAYVVANRVSASRFFWSRPVIVDFNAGAAGYGTAAVRADLEHRRPRYVVLQRHDWAPPPNDSATFFLGEPQLASWLRTHYHFLTRTPDYDIWEVQNLPGGQVP